jgi:hypothetical protein
MSISFSRSAPKRTQDTRVDPSLAPGWISGAERLPGKGERVYTNEGTGVVVRAFGKTSDGKRLLEITMDDGRKAPFIAAAANILVPSTPEIAASST